MKKLKVTEYNGVRVLTTEQLAQAYETTAKVLQYNFSYNKKRYIENTHYIKLEGVELRSFKANLEIQGNLKYAHILYLWTEKGALLHAKSINTDKAWEVYDYLVDFYFRIKEHKTEIKSIISKEEQKTKLLPVKQVKENEQSLPYMLNPLRTLKVLLQVTDEMGVKVNSYPFEVNYSVTNGSNIGIKMGVTVERACYELA